MTAIRPARVEDVEAMRQLIERYAREDRMLERTREFLIEHLRDELKPVADAQNGLPFAIGILQ